jgi:hypothetical protein
MDEVFSSGGQGDEFDFRLPVAAEWEIIAGYSLAFPPDKR